MLFIILSIIFIVERNVAFTTAEKHYLVQKHQQFHHIYRKSLLSSTAFISTVRNNNDSRISSQSSKKEQKQVPSFLLHKRNYNNNNPFILKLSGGFGGGTASKKSGKKKKKQKKKRSTNTAIVNPGGGVIRDVVDISEASSKLDSDALVLLEEAKGDINLARTNFLGYSLAYLKEAMPELYEKIKDGKSTTGASREVHHALLELTWDAVAAFIPVMTKSGKPEGNDILQRLTAIAELSTTIDNDNSFQNDEWKVLDVGCGNGLLLPFLLKEQQEKNLVLNYYGCDLSPRMIELAQKDYAKDDNGNNNKIRFEEIAFETIVEDKQNNNKNYDTIIFNGSIQFFSNTEEVLRMAKSLLNDDDNNTRKIVISHVNGASFVRKERMENPATVLSIMPTVEELQTISNNLNMELEVETKKEDKLDQFYLAVLSLPPSS